MSDEQPGGLAHDLRVKLYGLLRSQFQYVPDSFIRTCIVQFGNDVNKCFQCVGEENSRRYALLQQEEDVYVNGPNGYHPVVASQRQRSVSVPCSDVLQLQTSAPEHQRNDMYMRQLPYSTYLGARNPGPHPQTTFGAGTYVLRNQTNFSPQHYSNPARAAVQTVSVPLSINRTKTALRLIVQPRSQSDDERMDSPSTSGHVFSPGIQVTPASPRDQSFRLPRPRNLSVDKLTSGFDAELQRSRSVASSPVTAGGGQAGFGFCSPSSVWRQKRPDLYDCTPTGMPNNSHGSTPVSPLSNRRYASESSVRSSGSVPSLNLSSSHEMQQHPIARAERPSPLTPSYSFTSFVHSPQQHQHPQAQRQQSRVEIFSPVTSMGSVNSIVLNHPSHDSIRIGLSGRSSPTVGIIQRKSGQSGPVSPLSVVINSPTAQQHPIDQRRTSYPFSPVVQGFGTSLYNQHPSPSSHHFHEPAVRSSSISGPPQFAYNQPLHIQTDTHQMEVHEPINPATYHLPYGQMQMADNYGAMPSNSGSGGIQISFGGPEGTSYSIESTGRGIRVAPGRSPYSTAVNFGPQASYQQPQPIMQQRTAAYSASQAYQSVQAQPLAPSEDYVKSLVSHQEAQKAKLNQALNSQKARINELREDVQAMECSLNGQRKQSASQPKVNPQSLSELHAETRVLQADVQSMLKEISILKQNQAKAKINQFPGNAAITTSPTAEMPSSSATKKHRKSLGERIGRFLGGKKQPKDDELLRHFAQGRSGPSKTPSGSFQEYDEFDHRDEGMAAAPTHDGEKLIDEDPAENDGQSWDCSFCTFKNNAYMPKCEVCEMPRIKDCQGWVYVCSTNDVSELDGP